LAADSGRANEEFRRVLDGEPARRIAASTVPRRQAARGGSRNLAAQN
jgi:hypothetical protein